MRSTKSNNKLERATVLHALKMAVVAGEMWRYEHLIELATAAGATDADIDHVACDAIQALLTGAEQPLTARSLTHCS